MICEFPDPVLLKNCEWIDPKSKLCKKIVESLRVDMLCYRRQGIGLASPQIGLPYRVFVMDNRSLGVKGSSAFINPELLIRSAETDTKKEGCLSFPSLIDIPVERSLTIQISAYDVRGNRFIKSLKGMAARCFQHELDHLNGITLWHHASEKQKRRIERICSSRK